MLINGLADFGDYKEKDDPGFSLKVLGKNKFQFNRQKFLKIKKDGRSRLAIIANNINLSAGSDVVVASLP